MKYKTNRLKFTMKVLNHMGLKNNGGLYKKYKIKGIKRK